MLFRVLVVDDEPHIAQCVSKLLASHEEMSLDVYCAYSAEEAIVFFERIKIDVLLTDIEMGEMSGLDLIRMTRERWPSCRSLILTAHPKFEYAYNAMQLGIVNYLLKTEPDQRIMDEVRHAINLMEAEMNRSCELTIGAQHPVSENSALRRQMLLNLIQQQRLLGDADRAFALNSLGLGTSECLLLILCRLPAGSENASFEYTLNMLMGHYLTSRMAGCCCEKVQHLLVWVAHPTSAQSQNREQLRSWIGGTLEIVQHSLLRTSGLHVSLVWTVALPAELPLAFDEAERLLSLHTNLQDDYIYAFQLSALPRSESIGDRTTEFLKRYIASHLFEDVSLCKLSEVTGYNPSYVSQLFCQQNGQSLNKYIAQLKLERIVDLMRVESLSLNEIAERTGFDSRSYFNRFINRMTGLPPQKLRDECMAGRSIEEDHS